MVSSGAPEPTSSSTKTRVPKSHICWKGRHRLVSGWGPSPGRDHPGVWRGLTRRSSGPLAASHLRGPELTTAQLDPPRFFGAAMLRQTARSVLPTCPRALK